MPGNAALRRYQAALYRYLASLYPLVSQLETPQFVIDANHQPLHFIADVEYAAHIVDVPLYIFAVDQAPDSWLDPYQRPIGPGAYDCAAGAIPRPVAPQWITFGEAHAQAQATLLDIYGQNGGYDDIADTESLWHPQRHTRVHSTHSAVLSTALLV
jgi:hypothetical protein